MRRRLRLLAPVLATALLACLLVGPGPARSAVPVAGRDAVRVSDLPSVRQVAKIFPFLRGGSRSTYRAEDLSVRGRSCIYYRSVPATQVRWSGYATSTGDSPYFQGRQEPGFFIYRFTDVATAHAAMKVLRTYVQRCRGRHARDGSAVTLARFAPGPLGQERVGYEALRDNNGAGSGDYTDRELSVFVRHGRTVLESRIQVDDGRPSRRAAHRMATLLLRTSR
ncbi:hypothetical protein BH11ACT8_BH11ACT8_23490 [soil metagenome]